MPPPWRFFRWPWRSRAAIARDVDAELRFHMEMRTAELAATGLTPADARRRAEEEFGDVEFTRRYCRDLDEGGERANRFADRVSELRQDLRFALRSLRHNPGFTAVSLVTLAIAIGANVAVFSVTSAVLLEPLPYREPSRLFALLEQKRENPTVRSEISPADYVDYRAQRRAFDDIAAVTRYGGDLTWLAPSGEPMSLSALQVTANTFHVLGVRALHGRVFATGEDLPDRRNVVVLSHALWEELFHGDSAVIGTSMRFTDVPRTVIGVMPSGFTLGYSEQLWVPTNLRPALDNANRARKFHYLTGIARLKRGVTPDDGARDLASIARDLEVRYPDANTGHAAVAVPLRTAMVGDTRAAILVLNAAALLVLLIACANLANIALARGIARRREIAVRIALGAGRGRLVRQLLTESLLLGGAGGLVGVLIAALGTRALLAFDPQMLPPVRDVTISPIVVLFAVGLTVGTALLAGLVPALDGSRLDPHATLKSAGRGTAAREPLRRALVVAQTALAVVLLAGAGLLVRSFDALEHVRLGFSPDHVLTAYLTVSGPRYDSVSAVNGFFDGVLERVRNTPGVIAAGGVNNLPTLGGGTSSLVIEGEAVDPTHLPEIAYEAQTGQALKALRIPLLKGRTFDATDLASGPEVVLVNESFAKHFFPKGDAVGRRIRLGPNPASPWETVVGVVGDTRQRGLAAEPRPTAIEDMAQQGFRTLGIVVQTRGAPSDAIPALRSAVRELDPAVAVRSIATLDEIVNASIAGRRFAMTLVGSFAIVALVLAGVGVYGVLAYSVSCRTKEFGVRLALGATARSLLLLVLRQGLAWAVAGLAIGVVAAFGAGRFVETMLFGVRPTDTTTFVAVTAALLTVMVLACIIPARRATRADPLAAIREE